MKKNLIWASVTLVLILGGIGIFIFFANSGGKKGWLSGTGAGKMAAIVSAEKNSFYEVAAHLNEGGDLYLYLSTEKWLGDLSKTISDLRQLILSMENFGEEEQGNIQKAFDIANNLVKDSGIESISGVGMSSIAREKGLYHSKLIFHHYPGKDSGLLWSFFGKKPHSLDGLNLLPSTTALAIFSDADIPLLWSTIQQEISKSKIPVAEEWIRQLPSSFEQATGIGWEQFLASLGGEFGLVLTLDESKKVSLPIPGNAIEIPDSAVMLVVKAKNDAVFNRLDQLLAMNPQTTRTDQDGLKMRIMPLPIPLPMAVRPSMARSGDYLFIASTDTLIQEALAVKSGKKKGFKASDEFKKLSQGVPEEGNQFFVMSQSFGRAINELQKASLRNSADADPGLANLMQKFAGWDRASFAYSVSANTQEGWLATSNGSEDPSKTLLIQATVFPTALMAAIAVPSFLRARQRSQVTMVKDEARMISDAIDQYAIENNKAAASPVNWNDITPYLKAGSKLATGGGKDSLGNPIGFGPAVSDGVRVNPATKEEFLNATGGDTFWGPYS